MTPAIPDGYEIVTEARKGMKAFLDGQWRDCSGAPGPLVDGFTYIAPIRLRLGENYRCRNGMETGPIALDLDDGIELLYSEKLEVTYRRNGKNDDKDTESVWDIVAHIPKEKKMEPKIRYQSPRHQAQFTRDELAIVAAMEAVEVMPPDQRLTEAGNKITDALLLVLEYNDEQIEKERQKREKEIKVGDWFWFKTQSVHKCIDNDGSSSFPIKCNNNASFSGQSCTKISDPAFIVMLEAGVTK